MFTKKILRAGILSEVGYSSSEIDSMLKPVEGHKFPPAISTKSFLGMNKMPGGTVFGSRLNRVFCCMSYCAVVSLARCVVPHKYRKILEM